MCLIKVGSLEFATGKLGSRLILVLGHTKCGAIYGATKTYLDAGGAGKKAGVWVLWPEMLGKPFQEFQNGSGDISSFISTWRYSEEGNTVWYIQVENMH